MAYENFFVDSVPTERAAPAIKRETTVTFEGSASGDASAGPNNTIIYTGP